MPDISRSDSNRSDASRPRVSFNRNVHVKRINAPKTANAYSLASDGTSLIPTSIRRERPLTKKEMSEEAEVVLKQVDKVSCTATTNMKMDGEKPKAKRKKDPFQFLKIMNDKLEKGKYSSSDVDSASSQEYRIYRVNSPVDSNKRVEISKIKSKNEKKNYEFFSLDRKRLKREKNEVLDYLSLEKNEILEKMKKEKSKKAFAHTIFDKKDEKTKKTNAAVIPGKEMKSQPKISSHGPEEKAGKKKQLPLISETPAYHYPEKRKETNIDKMVKKLADTNYQKLTKNTGKIAMREPGNDTCHNDNMPFSYTSGEKCDSGLKLDKTIEEDLGNCKDLKSASPTSDVIYAQVIVSGRDGNAQKATVNERVASNEVGRSFVGEEPNQSQVGLNYKTEATQNDGVGERLVLSSDKLWGTDGDNCKEKTQNFNMSSFESHVDMEFGDSLYRRSSDSDHASFSPVRDTYTRIIKVTPNGTKSPTDLRDLSIRREILLSRSESQAKERFNSLKRLQEPSKIKRRPSNLNKSRPVEQTPRSDTWHPDEEKKVNEKPSTNQRKEPRDVDTTDMTMRKKRESKPEDKEEKWKNSDKVHLIKTDDDDNILRKLSRLGKSKSFIQDKPKKKGMEKVKMLFKKKKEDPKSLENEDDPLSARYIEYRGSDIDLSDRSTDSSPRRTAFRSETAPSKNSVRRELYTPSSSPSGNSPFKSARNNDSNRMQTLRKFENIEKGKRKMDECSSEINFQKSTNLRFFGDTDQESTTNEFNQSNLKSKYNNFRSGKLTDSDDDHQFNVPSRSESRMTNATLKMASPGKHKSKCDLDKPEYGLKQMNHGLNMTSTKSERNLINEPSDVKDDPYDFNGLKYRPGVIRSKSSLPASTKYGNKEKLRNLKSTPPITLTRDDEPLESRRVMSQGDLFDPKEVRDDKRGGRRKLYDSSAESATEGDSSQHSAKSMIYLHAATVGDIPRPRNFYKSDGRSQSKEDVNTAVDNSIISTPTRKTLSRSISVLAPWRPRHNKEDRTLHYNSDGNKGKPPTGFGKHKGGSSKDRELNELRFNTIGKENRRRKDLLR